jgi:hypothetical protein
LCYCERHRLRKTENQKMKEEIEKGRRERKKVKRNKRRGGRK